MEPTRERACRRRIAELEAEVAALKAQVARLIQQDAQLARQNAKRVQQNSELVRQNASRVQGNARLSEQIARLSKNSSNSSRPPSSDIVKPSKPVSSETAKRRIGGQPGHAKHERPPLAPDPIDTVRKHALKRCPDCGGSVSVRAKETRVVQQVELVERPIEVVEHRCEGGWCRRCRKMVHASPPRAVRQGGLPDSRLTSLVGYLKGVCHASFSTVRAFFRDVLTIPISRGQLAKVIGKVGAARMTNSGRVCRPNRG